MDEDHKPPEVMENGSEKNIQAKEEKRDFLSPEYV
jgi:hypothetical protein